MARERFQTGSLTVEGKTPQYVTRFRVYKADGTSAQKKVVIGPVKSMSKRAAEKRRSEIVAEHTQRLPKAAAEVERADTPFQQFYQDRFLVLKVDWSESQRDSFTYVMDRFVLPQFGQLPLAVEAQQVVPIQSCT